MITERAWYWGAFGARLWGWNALRASLSSTATSADDELQANRERLARCAQEVAELRAYIERLEARTNPISKTEEK